MSEVIRHYLISGRVQGVGFRAFTQSSARALGLKGWVRNLEDGRVETAASGSPDQIAQFEAKLKLGPAYGRVDALEVRDWKNADFAKEFAKEFAEEFELRKDSATPCC